MTHARRGSGALPRLGAALAAACAALVACGGDEAARRVDVLSAQVVPGVANHLSATLEIETSAAVRPEVTVVRADGATWRVPASGFLGPEPATEHRVAIVGLRPEVEHRFTIGGAGVVPPSEPLTYVPGPLPRGFPDVQVLVAEPARAAPGVTLFGIASPFGGPWIVGLDAEGVPVWYHRPDPVAMPAGIRRLADGTVAYVLTSWNELRFADFQGNPAGGFHADELGVDTLHHEPNLGPDGHLLLLSSEVRAVDGFPSGTLSLVGDVVTEVTRDGEKVAAWHLLDLLAPHRILPDSVIPFWNGEYPGIEDLRDWTHVNAVHYVAGSSDDQADDRLIVSVLNQRMVLSMDRSGALRWVVGHDDPDTTEDDGWPWLEHVGERELPDRQHSIDVDDAGNVLVYDNDFGSGASHPAVLAIDERRGEVEVIWDWYDPDRASPLFTMVGGACVALPGGHVLVQGGVNLDLSTWLTEVDRPTGDKVFQARVAASGGFNAVRAASLYPDG